MTAAPDLRTAPARWQAWDRFVEAVPEAGFMQTSWWADFRLSAGFGHFATTLRHGGALVGGAVVLTYEFAPGLEFYYIPEGPVLSDDPVMAQTAFDTILDTVARRRAGQAARVSHLRIEPRWERLPAFARGEPVPRRGDRFTEPRDTVCVDLRPPETAILAAMKPKGRYNVNVARRHGVTIVEDASPHGLAEFTRLYGATTDRHELDAKPPDYFADLVNVLVATGHGSVYFAECQGERLATAIAVFFGRRATYFYGGSLTARRHVMAPYLLHFELMRLAKARGCDWYDLWGVAPEDEPDHPWQNISVFKRKFGGREVRLVPTLDVVLDAGAYEAYRARTRG